MSSLPLGASVHDTDAKDSRRGGKKGGSGKRAAAGEMPAEFAQAQEALENDDFVQAVDLLHASLEKVAPLGPNHPHVLYVRAMPSSLSTFAHGMH